jgi:hypothetical protein
MIRINVPRELYNKAILSHIDYLVDDHNAKYFDDLDDIHKDKLVVLGIKALGCDIEIIIGSEANKHLANCLLNYDIDDQIELMRSIREASYEHFSRYFDQIIDEQRDEVSVSKMLDAGFRSYPDPQTGETVWSKSA